MASVLLKIKGLTVAFKQDIVVDNLCFDIFANETFALVGESGSGKSMTALSVLRLLPKNAKVSAKIMEFNHQSLLTTAEMDFAKIRGKSIGLIFQDAMSALNPVMSIGEQIAEAIQIHFNYSKAKIKQSVYELLQQVEIPEPQQVINEYPHQLSGGQCQRVMIAIALAAKPDLLIADEPTTALDVTIQAQILQLLKSIQQKTGMTLWLISHDLALVANVADRIAVMYQGKIVETESAQHFFKKAKHPYSLKLVATLPSINSCRDKPLKNTEKKQTCLLQVKNFKVHYPIRKGLFKRVVGHVPAVDGVSFKIPQGKTLALVGESGCGKTTLGKGLINLIQATSGQVFLNGIELTQLTGEALRKTRSEIQIVFQHPFAAMNPRMLAGEIIAEGIRALQPNISLADRQTRIKDLLQQVELSPSIALRYPHEFSGGQRQRICIARALAVAPKLIICDEPTSALDVSVQAQIINLLKRLQQEQKVSYLFISHDLAVVAEIADEVAVMYQGRIIEHGGVEQVLTRPNHHYTKKLLAAVPTVSVNNSK